MSTPGHHRSMPMAGILVNKAALDRYLELEILVRALLPLVGPIPRVFFKRKSNINVTFSINFDLNLNFTALMPHTTVVLPNLTIDDPSAVPTDLTLMRIGRNASNSRPSGRMLCAR